MSTCKHHHNHHQSDEKIDQLCNELLKKNKLSVTAPRKMILTLLIKEHGPFSVEDILHKLPENTCDQATVYRCLNQFVESNLVSSTNFNKDFALFEFNDPHHHHHHIVCKVCHKVESFDECLIDPIVEKLTSEGYKDISHKFEIFAVCRNCQK